MANKNYHWDQKLNDGLGDWEELVEWVDVNNPENRGFVIKDSGKREEFAGGMVRDTTEGKINYALIADGPMLKRWAQHLTTGAKKYAARNWMKAEGVVELERAKESAFRHFMQYFNGEIDEDHASAVFFNINEIEYIKEKMKNEITVSR